MSDDLISRQAAIDAIRASAKKYTGFMEMEMYMDDDAVEAIEGVPSAQQWIPVTEALPKTGEYVLVRYKNNDMAVACIFDSDENFTFWRAQTDEGWCAECDTEPSHWMPLPEPPKEEER